MGCRGVMDFSISPTWLLWRPAPGPGRSGRRGHRGRHGKGFTFTTVGCTKPTAIDVGARKSKPSLLTHSYSKTLRAWRSIVPMDHVYTHTHAHTHTHPSKTSQDPDTHTHRAGSANTERRIERRRTTPVQDEARMNGQRRLNAEVWKLELEARQTEGYIYLRYPNTNIDTNTHTHSHNRWILYTYIIIYTYILI